MIFLGIIHKRTNSANPRTESAELFKKFSPYNISLFYISFVIIFNILPFYQRLLLFVVWFLFSDSIMRITNISESYFFLYTYCYYVYLMSKAGLISSF